MDNYQNIIKFYNKKTNEFIGYLVSNDKRLLCLSLTKDIYIEVLF